MTRNGISDYALEHVAWDRDEADRVIVQNLSWEAFLEWGSYYNPTPVVRNTTRREREKAEWYENEMILASILNKDLHDVDGI